ncbi:uncharacterized protein LOC133198214 [Saccostrea echinata]|uniref:uncharacterized protein LOC133198214 n=1 Tax=Saccostrea echinata TaxID=191078 RepID=UPI002A80BB65|nr:uncharacterized protein LOC133198214 [Saccostrea echinata]
MAQAMMNSVENRNYIPASNEGLGYALPTMPDTQDPIGFDLGLYNMPEPMTKEDMGILTTTLDGIVNMLTQLKEYNTRAAKKNEDTGAAKKSKQTDPCFICKELGHWAPDCPRKKQNLCYKCGNFGHWAHQCTDDSMELLKEVEKLEK